MTNIPTLIAELRRLGEAASNRPHNVKCEFISTAKPPSFQDENQACHATLAAFECANAAPLLCDEIESLRHEVEKLRAALVPHSERLARLKAYESSPNPRGAT